MNDLPLAIHLERSSGAIRVRRIACAHDCGLIINPDALRTQIEGNILQALLRTLHEEVKFDRARDERRLGELPDPQVPRVPRLFGSPLAVRGFVAEAVSMILTLHQTQLACGPTKSNG